MMLRYKLVFPALLFCFIAEAQTLPPPPDWEEPTEEEAQHDLMKSHATLDELIFPLNHYLPEENIYFEAGDSLFQKNKIRRAFFYTVPGDTARALPDRYYTTYTRSGQVESTSVLHMESGDSTVRKWSYTPSGKMKSYVTLNCDPLDKPGKWYIHGDSMSFKYNATDQLIEMTRNSVTKKNGPYTKSFVSKETYTYNTDGQVATKKIDMFKYVYLYNTEKKLVRVTCVSQGNVVEMIDSFAWSQSGNTEAMEHWAVSKGSVRLLMDKLVTEKGTGRHLSYSLFPLEKFNYIRDIYGGCTLAFEYDKEGREIRRKITWLDDGTLLAETAVQYDLRGRPARVEFTYPFRLPEHEDETEEAYDKRMERFVNCYITTTLTYQLDKTDALVEFIEVHQTMHRITGETRVMLEKAPGAGRVYVRHEYY